LIFPLISVINIFLIQKSVYQSITYSLGCLLIVAFSIYYFWKCSKAKLCQPGPRAGLLDLFRLALLQCLQFPGVRISQFASKYWPHSHACYIVSNGLREYLAIFIFHYCVFMSPQTQEIYIVILIATALALLLVGFIVTSLFLYQRRQHRQEQQLVRMKDEYQQELLRSQLEIQETTFKTIAMELHDNIGQVLSVVKLSLSVLPLDKVHPAYEGVQGSRDMLNKVIYDMGNLTKSLHTDRIAQIGLVEAIRFDLESLKRTGLLEVGFAVTGEEYRLEDQRSIFLYRMFQEMLNNILKHSKATRVNIAVIYSIDNKFVLKVEDNGVGFDIEKKRTQTSSSSGIGLKSMTNRASLIGAQINVQSQPGKGTSIIVELPLELEKEIL
jgi:two-component system NarL family sensor kinase